MQPYLHDVTPEEQEIGELVNWLYTQPWGTVGGPLHIITDDQNVEDHWFAEDSMVRKWVEHDPYSDTQRTEDEKVKLRRFLDLMKDVAEDRREPVLWNAETIDGPY